MREHGSACLSQRTSKRGPRVIGGVLERMIAASGSSGHLPLVRIRDTSRTLPHQIIYFTQVIQ